MPLAIPTWNGFTAADPVPVQRLAFQQMMMTALDEREFLAGGSAYAINAGDDLQHAATSGQLPIFRMQDLARNDTGTHFMSAVDAAGQNWSWVDLNQYGSIAGSTTATMHIPLTRASVFGYVGLAFGWPLKRGRSITSLTATTDQQGNTAVAGQVARGADASLRGGFGGGGNLSGTFTCTAPGTWVLSPGATIDVVGAYAAAPNTIALQANGAAGDLANDTGHPIADAVGDRRGPWLFSSFRDICNQMQMIQVAPVGTFNPDSSSFAGATGTGGTWAAAKADAEARWNAGTYDNILGFDQIGTYSIGGMGGATGRTGTYVAFICRRSGTFGVRVPGSSTWAANIDWWDRFTKDTEAALTSIFDANGDAGIAQGWTKFGSSVGVTGFVDSPVFGSVAGSPPPIPTWCDDPTPSGQHEATFRGWWYDVPLAVMDFNVTGGFTYTSSSP